MKFYFKQWRTVSLIFLIDRPLFSLQSAPFLFFVRFHVPRSRAQLQHDPLAAWFLATTWHSVSGKACQRAVCFELVTRGETPCLLEAFMRTLLKLRGPRNRVIQ